MLETINLILNSNSKIRNFEEDKIATLRNNPGLRYIGEKRDKNKKYYNFSGNFYLTNKKHELIETFEISIYLDRSVQGQGIGSQVLEMVPGKVTLAGLNVLLAYVFSSNLASIKLFQKFGYDQWGFLPGVAELDHRANDLVILGKHFD